MKRVSFKVAKAIKKAGYPQDYSHDYFYKGNGILATSVTVHKTDDISLFSTAPTYLEVWLWLWREKNIQIAPCKGLALTKINNQWENLIPRELWKDYNDPEEAIIVAIEYLVTNNLIR